MLGRRASRGRGLSRRGGQDVVSATTASVQQGGRYGWAGALLVAGPLAVHGLVVIGAVGVLHMQRVDKAVSSDRVSVRTITRRYASTMERCGQPTCFAIKEAGLLDKGKEGCDAVEEVSV